MSKLTLSGLERFRDLGLLVMRVGIGLCFFYVHGLPKLQGGEAMWTKVGGAVGLLGIEFGHMAFGLAASLAECVGGLLVAVGFATRWTALALAATLALASYFHLTAPGEGLPEASHALKMAVFFLGLFLVGPGRYSVDARLR